MIREDFKEILRLVRPGSRVLDVGCGEGVLLDLLTQEKQVDGRGLEISAAGVAACMSRGLSVVQGDADQDLDHFPDRTFDYAVLSQTLQATRRPRHVLDELLRIADRAVVSFPNFGHWRVRWSLLHRGRMPETEALPLPWWATPNIHLCTLADFLALTEDLDVRIDACAAFAGNGPGPADRPDQGPSRTGGRKPACSCSAAIPRPPAPRPLTEPPAPSGDLFDG
jgi:methionine biosynthesis protein MetW